MKDNYQNEFFYEYHQENDPIISMAKNHYHETVEIYYLEKGECSYFVNDRTYYIGAGDIIVIPEGVIHKTTYTGSHARSLLYLPRRFVPALVADVFSTFSYLYRNPEVEGEVKGIFEKIRYEYENPDRFSDEILKTLTYNLFFLLARNENQAENRSDGSAFVSESVRYILDNFSSEITLTELSKKYSVSPEHFSRTFKKETGFGFSEYLTLVRLKNASEMLISNRKKSIAEIAFSCGFNDSNYFSERFKRVYDKSPLSFRKSIDKE